MFWMRYLPTDYNIPPTLYSILESLVNFGTDDKTKIKDLASEGREDIFDFDYPLSTNVSRETFEVMILNHFLMRRIGYDTMTAFKIALNVKLNEIMPTYNKLFDMMDDWGLFDNEVETRQVLDGRTTTTSNTNTIYQQASNTSDRRYSELPNNQLTNVQDGSYVTDYNYDTNTSNANSTDTLSGSISDSGNLRETKTKDAKPIERIEIYKEFINNRNHIMTMIFKELDSLFYGLV